VDDVSEAAAGLQIEISSVSDGTPVLVALAGEMDIVSSRKFTEAVFELEKEAPDRIVVDLAGLTFIDSSGINVLVQAARTIEARGGSIVLAAPSRHVRHVFEIARVGDVVEISDEPAETLRRHGPPVVVRPNASADEQ
jgi:anti-anti-sigma factor